MPGVQLGLQLAQYWLFWKHLSPAVSQQAAPVQSFEPSAGQSAVLLACASTADSNRDLICAEEIKWSKHSILKSKVDMVWHVIFTIFTNTNGKQVGRYQESAVTGL
jgi:hypothetical protein